MKWGRLRDLVLRRTEVWDAERWVVDGVLHGNDRGMVATLLRALLTPLAWLHQIGLEAYLLPYRLGIRKRYRLPVPVLSIGNLSSGGTGKTPTAALVAGHLRQQGKRVVLLSRGHRGQGERESAPRIVSDGTRILLGPDEAGDEPVLLASLLAGVPVIVCRDRRKSGRLAVERFAPEVLVLDDGLQYWQLARDLDIVLLDARRPLDNGWVLPRGLLREPPSHLARAGVIILTRADRVPTVGALATIKERVRDYASAAVPVLTARHAPVGWVTALTPDTLLPLPALAGRAALVFCGIADGEAFVEAVRTLGIRVAAVRLYGDHHLYTADEVHRLQAVCGPDVIAVTTEKDAVKLQSLFGVGMPALFSLRIAMRLDDPEPLWEHLKRVV